LRATAAGGRKRKPETARNKECADRVKRRNAHDYISRWASSNPSISVIKRDYRKIVSFFVNPEDLNPSAGGVGVEGDRCRWQKKEA